jgi:KRAB domain-containing zinc finger protein
MAMKPEYLEPIKPEHLEPIKLEQEDNIKTEDTTQPVPADTTIKRESFRCGVCGEYFFYEKYFLEHVQEHHQTPEEAERRAGTVQEEASETAQEAGRTENLCSGEENNRARNSGEGSSCAKPFKCNVCSFSTAYKQHLTIHCRIHTGEKPFKCNVCNYATGVLVSKAISLYTAGYTLVNSLILVPDVTTNATRNHN